ncbi:MFS transporter [Aneurinibacillus aneurinilyticus]|uniref:Transporter, major facilitator family protein n=1 Tax=Aneurinibacillus aneurinilyticus ATCC 12856 TaxID=649747 RepID=U1XBF3_ANEAE|nr:MFS transporter [Aneurinibacillus aneurinilyticus]ERI11878.1 transporter, major facilitator family protein [Aneurinibacillus aneurinilyticus ATCC 12856]MED0708612.1 MFS transporter [Aneurinibacillus aneurinilyticus]MED0725545.1 MFS transporter [Aneurinibacillus aneurinilyticus]MED0733027.1 MFS transporter [Aneurinibacillus aneurinilyticus]MED0743846.1 MFS transporter [Aneurinibacillus aneurinilyticus]
MNNIWILSFVSFFTDMGTYMVTPLIPIFLASSGPVIIGIIDGLSESLASVLKFYSGRHSDRWKKRKGLAMIGYGLSGLGRIFLIISSSWMGVFIWKLIDRTGKGIRTAPRDALISESGGKKKQGRVFGLHQMMDMLGASIGIGAAYFIIQMEGNQNFHVVFLYSLLPVIIGWILLFGIKEQKQQRVETEKSSTVLPNLDWKLLNPNVKKLLLIVFLFTIVNSSNAFLLLRATDLGISTANVLLLYLIFHLTASAFSYISGAFSDRFGRRGILTVGYALYGFVYIGFAEVTTIFGLIVLFTLYGLYSALTKGIEKALVADIANPGVKGTALGFYAMVTGIGLFPASLLTGWLWQIFGAQVSFYINGIIAIVTSLLLFKVLSFKARKTT